MKSVDQTISRKVTSMFYRLSIYFVVSQFFMVSLLSLSCTGQEQETPVGQRWWPSEWGPEDQRGALNRITPAKVREANQ